MKGIKQRLEFIDVARSLAILLMLEGHFIIMALDPSFRESGSSIFTYWQAVRSITAPLFFTVSGMIFTYLLLRNDDTPYFSNIRVRKGAKRGLMLIALGYILHLQIYAYIKYERFGDFFFSQHVLQCIGYSLLSIILVYGIYRLVKVVPMGLLLAITAFFAFIITPTIYDAITGDMPLWLRNIFIRKEIDSRYVSGFPIFPWVGYSLFGGAMGAVLYKKPKILHNWKNVVIFVVTVFYFAISIFEILRGLGYVLEPLGFSKFMRPGLQFIKASEVVGVLLLIYLITVKRLQIRKFIIEKLPFVVKWYGFIPFAIIGTLILSINSEEVLGIHAIYGHVSLFIALVLGMISFIPWNYNLFIKVGQHTLLIYVVHAIILYGSFFGYGLNHIIKKRLHPWEAILGAILFMTFFIFLVKYREKIRAFIGLGNKS